MCRRRRAHRRDRHARCRPPYAQVVSLGSMCAGTASPGGSDARTRHHVLGAAEVYEQVASDTPQAGLQVEHRLQQELGAVRARLRVAKGRQRILPRVEAVQGHDLRTPGST